VPERVLPWITLSDERAIQKQSNVGKACGSQNAENAEDPKIPLEQIDDAD
jgi:hypothetical protein